MGKIKPQALLQQSKKKKGPARISISTVITCNLTLILIGLSVYAAYKYWYSRASLPTDMNENFATTGGRRLMKFELPTHVNFATTGGRRLMKFELPTHVILNTTAGSISLELFQVAKPRVVDRFLKLCENGHFEGASFYHVIKNDILQVCKDQNTQSAKHWLLEASNTMIETRSIPTAPMLVTTKTSLENGRDFDLFISPRRSSVLSDKFITFGRVLSEDIIQNVQSLEKNVDQIKVYIQRCLVESATSV